METILPGMNIYTIAAIILWTFPWKAWALWLAARRGDIWWFLALLLLNTLALLDIIYIFLIAKQSSVKQERGDE
jgi:hypothetical protein